MPPRKSNGSTADEGAAGLPSSSTPTAGPSKEKKSDEIVIEVCFPSQFWCLPFHLRLPTLYLTSFLTFNLEMI